MGIRPTARDQSPMPAQQRLGPHEEDVPAAPRQHSTQRSEQRPVVRLEARPTGLSAKNRQLVPEYEDLELLLPVTSSEEHDQLEQPSNDDVQR
jgi:hypothetical protein